MESVVVFLLAASSVAMSQDAVQWRIEDGGNGHWYMGMAAPGISWEEAAAQAEALGGYLCTVPSAEENLWVFTFVASDPSLWNNTYGPWIGGYQDTSSPEYSEPDGAWSWVTGESWSYTNWTPGDPSNTNGQDHAAFGGIAGNPIQPTWNDLAAPEPGGFIVEWSNDCNNDGIVDYGQILDGTLTDDDGDGVPDCCELGTCLTPVQWSSGAGANGHWYVLVKADLSNGNLDALQDIVRAELGADLVSIRSQGEQDFVTALSDGLPGWTALGAKIMTSFPCGPDSWEWFDNAGPNTPLEFTAWDDAKASPQPNCIGSEYIATWGVDAPASGVNAGRWHDVNGEDITYTVIEWSADCNGDGLVDYGQILDGSLNDVNKDGVPDECGPFVACCIGSTCISASSFACQQAGGTFENSDAGCSSQVCPSDCPGDITDDGQVDFTDLLIIVSTWGPCSDG